MIFDFVTNLELLADQNKLEMRKKVQKNEVAVNGKMIKIFDQQNKRGENCIKNQLEYKKESIEGSEEADMSTQFLLDQKKSTH